LHLALGAPRWSPDGSRIVFGAQDGRIYVIPAAGGPPTRLLKGSAPDWSPDGRSIVFSREQDSRRANSVDLWVVDADGTGLRPLTNTPGLFELWPAWSPDGSKILFAATKGGCGAARLFVLNANGSFRRWLGRTTATAPSWQPVPGYGAAPGTPHGLRDLARRHGRSCGF
jgi:Tol biopolymer transport system component